MGLPSFPAKRMLLTCALGQDPPPPHTRLHPRTDSSTWSEPTPGPGFVQGGLLLELLSQVLEPLQAADLREQPVFIALLHLL